jgi:hypothetical protein
MKISINLDVFFYAYYQQCKEAAILIWECIKQQGLTDKRMLPPVHKELAATFNLSCPLCDFYYLFRKPIEHDDNDVVCRHCPLNDCMNKDHPYRKWKAGDIKQANSILRKCRTWGYNLDTISEKHFKPPIDNAGALHHAFILLQRKVKARMSTIADLMSERKNYIDTVKKARKEKRFI